MIIRVILIVFCTIFTLSPAKSQKIDSLKALLQGKDGLDRVHILNALSIEYIGTDQVLALQYGREGYVIVKTFNDSLKIVRTGRAFATSLRRLGKIDSANIIYQEVLSISERNNYLEERVLILNSYALSLTFKAEYDKALALHFESLNISSNFKDSLSLITTIHNIAFVYYKLKDFEKALQYFNYCYELKKMVKDTYDEDILMTNIGLCYAYLQLYHKAEWFVNKGIELCGVNCSNERILQASFAKGIIYFGLNAYDSAEEVFLKSYLLSKNLNNIRFELDNIDYLSQIYLHQNNIALATFYLETAERLIGKNVSFSQERIKIYLRFSQLYLKTRNFEQASHYQLKYSQLKDSVYNEELITNLMKIEAEYLERENTAKISAQGEVIALKEEIITRQRSLNKIIGLLGLITIGFVIVLVWNFRQKKNLNFLLDKKIKERTYQLELSRNELIITLNERDLMINRASDGITGIRYTIKGLCFTAMREVSDPVARSYMERIDKASWLLAGYVGSFFQK